MKLKRVRILAPEPSRASSPASSYEVLAAYAGYDREVHGEAIDVWPLLVHMLREFVSADRAFHAWRRQAGGAVVGRRLGPKTGPGWSRGMGGNGTGVVLLQDKEQFTVSQNPATSGDKGRNSRPPGVQRSPCTTDPCWWP